MRRFAGPEIATAASWVASTEVAPFSRSSRGPEEQPDSVQEPDLALLAQRLEGLTWPEAPAGARERVLKQLLARVGADDRAHGPTPDASGEPA